MESLILGNDSNLTDGHNEKDLSLRRIGEAST